MTDVEIPAAFTSSEERAPEPPNAAAADKGADPLDLYGRRIAGRLAVVRYLGRTSVAHIYRVIHALMDQPAFLKVTRAAGGSEEDGIPPRIRREAKTLAHVEHPGILRALDAGVADGLAYLSHEWADGPNLRSLIMNTRSIPVGDLVMVALQLIDVLDALHGHGLVLRSFDPERILVPSPGGKTQLKLFDLSRLAEIGQEEGNVKDSRLGLVMRSTRYMAPEDMQGAAPDPRADLYSYGLLLYELISGEYPYTVRGSGPTAYMAGHLREEPRPIALGPSHGVPADLPAIVRRLLAKDPEHRFESAGAVRRILQDVVVPDVVRLSTPSGRRALEGWRNGVRLVSGRQPQQERD